MKLIRELRNLLESRHGDTWWERFRHARDVTGGPNTNDEVHYYKHRTYKSNSFDVWYFADSQPNEREPMDIAALHDDPEVQAKLRSKIHVPVPEKLEEIETFVVFQQNHSYAMWDDWTGNGMFAMVDWDAKNVSSHYDTPMRELMDKLDDPNTLTDDDVRKYVDLVKEAYE